MTDDELSEFAEMLADACERHGNVGTDFDCYCPLGAAVGGSIRRPIESAQAALGISLDVVLSFAAGYDDGQPQCYGGPHWTANDKAYQLGRLFRELYP